MQGQNVIFVNMDETSVKRCYDDNIGTIAGPQWRPAGSAPPTAGSSLGHRRMCITLAAFISPESDVQQFLPQVLITSRRAMSPLVLRHVEIRRPARMFVWREKKGWNTTTLMIRMVRLLAACLAAARHDRPIVLCLDSAPMHVQPSVVRAAEDKNIWICLIPTRATFLFQPADVSLFGPLKMWLQKHFVSLKCRGVNGTVSQEEWIKLLFGLHAFISRKDHSRSFEATGLEGDELSLSTNLRQHGVTSARVALRPDEALCPSRPNIRASYNRGVADLYAVLFHPVMPELD